MQVFFIYFFIGFFCGEIRKVYVEFVNVSKCFFIGLKVVFKYLEFFIFGGNTVVLILLSFLVFENCSVYKIVVIDFIFVCIVFILLVFFVDFGIGIGSQLEVIFVFFFDIVFFFGVLVQLLMWLRGLDEEGVYEINFLFYYESVKKQFKIR